MSLDRLPPDSTGSSVGLIVRPPHRDLPSSAATFTIRDAPAKVGDWTRRYGDRHRMHRVTQWPAGIIAPQRVRIYLRNGSWLLQWWEPSARKNQAERIDGDLVSAIARAREIEQRLLNVKTSGRVAGRVRHHELVDRFLADLGARADAGEIQPRSVARFRSALNHYLAFTDGAVSRKYPFAVGVNREFSLQFAAFLRNRSVSPNGSGAAQSRPMRGDALVWDVVRAMFEWAADPDRGRALPPEFRSPFRRAAAARRPVRDPFGEPDITLDMCKAMFTACDAYQLRLFAPFVFYGLRASEPAYLFGEYLDSEWLRAPCATEISYTTKGKRDKRLPLFEPLASLLGPARPGLLYVRRAVAEGAEKPELVGASLAELAAEIQLRINRSGRISAAERHAVRDRVLSEAGGVSYDRIQGEFGKLARFLNWPLAATLKDLRHSFATVLAEAGMPEPYRQYLMGHSPSSAAIHAYTHLTKIGEWYQVALAGPWAELIDLLRSKANSLTPSMSATS